MTQSYQLRDLGPLGAAIHNGGQGIIYALPQNPSLVFKRYISTNKTNQITLSALIDWPAGLPRADQLLLQDSTAWPNALVWAGQRLIGVTMPRAPERFTFSTPGGRKSTTLSIAISQKRTHIRQHIPIPNQTERLWLAYHLCQLLALFERTGIIYLDLSSKNILWSLDPKPAVFLVDCDSAIPVWRLNSAQIVRTSNWYDPWYRNPLSHEEIRGLFSLIFARLVFAKQIANAKEPLVLEPANNPLAKSFQALVDVGYSPDFTQRPNLATWQMLIEKALGIEHDPLKRILKYVPGATRLLQQTKHSYEKLKNTAVVFNIKRRDLAIIVAIALYILVTVVFYKSIFYEDISGQNQLSSPPRTLFERVWKNDNSIQCMPATGSPHIYAAGKQNERNLRIEVPVNDPVGERHFIIKPGVAYWWHTSYISNNQGSKRYIQEITIKKLLNSFQEDSLRSNLQCESWFDPDETLFELPSHITFNN